MRHWKLIALSVLPAIAFLPIPYAWATNCPACDLIGVPEPGTLLLFAAGVGGLVGIVRRRHRR